MQRDDIILGLKDDLAKVRAELVAMNNRLAWLEGYVEGRDSYHSPAFVAAVEAGMAASARNEVVSHDVILDDIDERRHRTRTAA